MRPVARVSVARVFVNSERRDCVVRDCVCVTFATLCVIVTCTYVTTDLFAHYNISKDKADEELYCYLQITSKMTKRLVEWSRGGYFNNLTRRRRRLSTKLDSENII